MDYIFRKANLKDTPFLAKTIIEAEKSGGDKIGLAKMFDLTETELTRYLIQILEEEIEGCEFSVDSFVVAEHNGKPVAAFGGWIEEENEDGQPSAILKSNLIGFIFPKDKLAAAAKSPAYLRDIKITREPHAHQLEYAFVDAAHRGKGLIKKIIGKLLSSAKEQSPGLKKSQVQVFANNPSAIEAYEKMGYKEIHRVESTHPGFLNYYAHNVKLVLEKQLEK